MTDRSTKTAVLRILYASQVTFVRKKKFDKSLVTPRSSELSPKMKAERGLSINNPNESWLESKGTWFTYVLLIIIGHLVILSVPFFDTPTAWTLTNMFHNLSMFIFLHYLKGTPFQTADQGKARRLTHWEQLNHGEQFTETRKFFTLVPIFLFMVTSFYTKYDGMHFVFNALSLLGLSLVPKFPQMYKVRLFGLNKY